MSEFSEEYRRLQALLDSVTESILETSDEEILEDIRCSGQDPAYLAQEAVSAFESALQVRGRRRLQAAREGLEKQHDAIVGQTRRRLNDMDVATRRSMLDQILARDDLPSGLTLAFREGGNNFSDEEVFSALEDLADLGFLDD